MVLPVSWWLLSICILCWCYDVRSTGSLDLQSESWRLPVLLFYDKEVIKSTEDLLSIKDIEEQLQKAKTRIDIMSVDIGKNMEDVKDSLWNANSQLCQNLAKDPKLQQGYIPVFYIDGLYLLSTEICSEKPRSLLEIYISTSARNLIRDVEQVIYITEIP